MSTVTFTTDHDPYPAKAGNGTLVNTDPISNRTFLDLRSIPSSDLTKVYTFTYRGGATVVDNPQPVTFPREYDAGTSRPGITVGSSGAFTCPTLSTVVISGITGQFTCSATTLEVGDRIRISGTKGGGGTITGYTNATSYKVSSVTGTSPNVTGFTLKLTSGDTLVTATGTPTGLTYTRTMSLKVNDRIAISGLLGFSDSIVNYGLTGGQVYLVTAVTGASPDVTGFTLKTTENVALTTAAPSDVTFDPDGTVVIGADTLPVLDISTATASGSNSKIRILNHKFNNLAEVTYTVPSGSALSSLQAGTKYFVKKLDANTIQLYDTLTNATNGTSVGRKTYTTSDDDNTGTHRLTATLSELLFTSQIYNPEPSATLLSHAVGITSNGVLILPSGSKDSPLMGSSPSISAPFGFDWNVVQTKADFNLDDAGGKPMLNNDSAGDASGKDIYCYRSGDFVSNAWDSVLTGANSYYGTAGLTHPDGHSKIIGIAFDGYPIYGPKGYVSPMSNLSAPVNMKSSYKIKESPASGRIYTYEQQAAGSFIEDYEYSAGHENSTLDEHNGRFCVTPDFPEGTYAYFVTTTYPYIIGPSTKAQRSVTIT